MDAGRAIAELRELDALTGGPDGAQRVCWTPVWEQARGFLVERLEALPGVAIERDAAGNIWATLAGERAETVVLGSHLDSVPDGGWLDGALGVFGALEVLRECAAAGRRPARTVALVDWADEEGARFGRSLLGSSAFAGTLDPAAVRGLRDGNGTTLADALAEHGVDVEAMNDAGHARRADIAAYLELHIEQGPVLDAEGLPCGAVLGCFGVERHRLEFIGRAAHAGSTPMDRRADAAVAAATVAAGLPAIARRHGGVCTAGRLELEPGIATATAGRAELYIDQRHLEPKALAALLLAARELWEGAARDNGCTVSAHPVWSIEPIRFDEGLVATARAACSEVAGSDRMLPSGALHDAAELARIAPAAMVFAASIDGVSHAREEDTSEHDLTLALEAFGSLARHAIADGR